MMCDVVVEMVLMMTQRAGLWMRASNPWGVFSLYTQMISMC